MSHAHLHELRRVQNSKALVVYYGSLSMHRYRRSKAYVYLCSRSFLKGSTPIFLIATLKSVCCFVLFGGLVEDIQGYKKLSEYFIQQLHLEIHTPISAIVKL